MIVRETVSGFEYKDAIRAKTIKINGRVIGDLVEFDAFGTGHRVVLTAACRPYSNGSFATRDGAMNYMKLVADAVEG